VVVGLDPSVTVTVPVVNNDDARTNWLTPDAAGERNCATTVTRL
jgi:hypothetical protein